MDPIYDHAELLSFDDDIDDGKFDLINEENDGLVGESMKSQNATLNDKPMLINDAEDNAMVADVASNSTDIAIREDVNLNNESLPESKQENDDLSPVQPLGPSSSQDSNKIMNTRLIVLNLPPTCTVDQLKEFINEKLDCGIVLERVDGIYMGAAMVWVTPRSATVDVAASLHDSVLDKQKLVSRMASTSDVHDFSRMKLKKASKPHPSWRASVSNINTSSDPEQIETFFRKRGPNMESFQMIGDNEGGNKKHSGNGYAMFKKKIAALHFCNAVNKTHFMGCKVSARLEEVKTSRILPKPDRYRLLISGVADDVSAQELEEIFSSEVNSPVKAHLKPLEGASHAGKGYLEFQSEEAVRTAHTLMDGNEIGSSCVTLTLDIRLGNKEEIIVQEVVCDLGTPNGTKGSKATNFLKYRWYDGVKICETHHTTNWTARKDMFGVQVSNISYQTTVEKMINEINNNVEGLRSITALRKSLGDFKGIMMLEFASYASASNFAQTMAGFTIDDRKIVIKLVCEQEEERGLGHRSRSRDLDRSSEHDERRRMKKKGHRDLRDKIGELRSSECISSARLHCEKSSRCFDGVKIYSTLLDQEPWFRARISNVSPRTTEERMISIVNKNVKGLRSIVAHLKEGMLEGVMMLAFGSHACARLFAQTMAGVTIDHRKIVIDLLSQDTAKRLQNEEPEQGSGSPLRKMARYSCTSIQDTVKDLSDEHLGHASGRYNNPPRLEDGWPGHRDMPPMSPFCEMASHSPMQLQQQLQHQPLRPTPPPIAVVSETSQRQLVSLPSTAGDVNSETYGLTTDFLDSLNIKLPLVKELLVTNLDGAATVADIKDLFSIAGTVDTIEYNEFNVQAIVEMAHPVEAVQAVSMLHNQEYFDRVLGVRLLRPNDPDNLVTRAVVPAVPRGLKTIGKGLGIDGLPLSTPVLQSPVVPQIHPQQSVIPNPAMQKLSNRIPTDQPQFPFPHSESSFPQLQYSYPSHQQLPLHNALSIEDRLSGYNEQGRGDNTGRELQSSYRTTPAADRQDNSNLSGNRSMDFENSSYGNQSIPVQSNNITSSYGVYDPNVASTRLSEAVNPSNSYMSVEHNRNSCYDNPNNQCNSRPASILTKNKGPSYIPPPRVGGFRSESAMPAAASSSLRSSIRQRLGDRPS